MPSLGKFIKHQQQCHDKFLVTLQIHTAFGITETSPTALFFVSYKRGSTHHGSSMKLHLSSPRTIAFDQTCNFSFPCTLYYGDVSKKDYEKKHVTLTFHKESESDPQGFTTHGKAHIDLSMYAKEVSVESGAKSFPLTEVLAKHKGGDALKLQVTLTMKCVHVLTDGQKELCEEVDSAASTPRSVSPPPSLSRTTTPTPISRSTTPTSISRPTTPTSMTSPTPTAPIHIPSTSSTTSGSSASLGITPTSVPPLSLPLSHTPSGTALPSSAIRTSSHSHTHSGGGSARKADDESVSSISSFSSYSSGSGSPPPSPTFSQSLDADPLHHLTPPTSALVSLNLQSNGASLPPSGNVSVHSNGSGGGGGRRSRSGSMNDKHASSSGNGACKSYLTSPPAKLHLLQREASDTLLNVGDITKRLANRHPELCGSSGGGSTNGPAASSAPPSSRADLVRSMDFKAGMHRRSNSDAKAFSIMKGQTLQNEGKSRSLHDINPEMHKIEQLQKQKQDILRQKQELAKLQQIEDERFLTEEVTHMPPAYSNGVPVLGYVLFRTLLQWRAFHPTNSHILSNLINSFKNTDDIPKSYNKLEVILYRLSSVTTLLHILRKELQVLSSDNVSTVLRDFETKLKDVLMLFYQMYYNEVKEELDGTIDSMLARVKTDGTSGKVTTIFEKHLKLLRESIFFETLRQQIIYQIFYYFNARVLNALLQKTIPCQCEVGLGLKMAILHVENWASTQKDGRDRSNGKDASNGGSNESNGDSSNSNGNGNGNSNGNGSCNGKGVLQLQCDSAAGWVPSVCRRALSGARQAADVLVVSKQTLIESKIREEVCPSLTQPQLLALLERYTPDEFDPEPIHPGVLRSIGDSIENRQSLLSDETSSSSPILNVTQPAHLDTHFTQPLPLDASSISIPPSITDRPGFAFLRDVNMDKYNQPW